jgi:hypothetical protein
MKNQLTMKDLFDASEYMSVNGEGRTLYFLASRFYDITMEQMMEKEYYEAKKMIQATEEYLNKNESLVQKVEKKSSIKMKIKTKIKENKFTHLDLD